MVVHVVSGIPHKIMGAERRSVNFHTLEVHCTSGFTSAILGTPGEALVTLVRVELVFYSVLYDSIQK